MSYKREENLGEVSVGICAIVSIESSAGVSVVSSKNTDHNGLLKFVSTAGTTTIVGCLTPGVFINYIQAAFQESCHLMVTEPRAGHCAPTETLSVNLPSIAL